MSRKSFTLSQKVLLAFIMVLLPVVFVFSISYRSVKSHVEGLVLEDIRTIADDREGYLLLFLDMYRRRIMDFATDGYIVSGLEMASSGDHSAGARLSDYIERYKLPLDRNLYKLCVYGMDGKVVASTLRDAIGEDRSGEEYFLAGMKGAAVTERAGGLRGVGELAFSAPIYNRKTGEPMGVLAGFMPLKELNKVLTGEHAGELGAISWDIIKGRKTMEVYLVNRDRLMLTPSRFVKDTVYTQTVDTEPVRLCLGSAREFKGFYDDYRGVRVAGASMCFPSLGWVLLVEVDTAEVLSPMRGLERSLLVTFAAVVGLIGVFFAFVMRSTVGQIRGLLGAAKRISEGEYGFTIPVVARDEIGLLSESFNAMSRGIRERTEALRMSEERLKSLLNNTSNVVYIKDSDGRYLFINKRYESLFNIRNEDVQGKTDFDIFPEEIAEAFRINDRLALESERPIEVEEQAPLAGEIRTYLSVKFRIPDSPYSLCGVSTDITAIKRAGEALRRSEASLANAQRIAHLGNWDWDIVKNDLHWSDEIYRIFGIEKSGFGATYEAFLGCVHPDDRESVKSAVSQALCSGAPYSIDHRVVLPDGTERVVHEEAEVVFDRSGKPVKMSGTVQDVTERKMAEDEVRKLNAELEKRVEERTAQLEAANRELEAFSYSVAHDLRAPLRIIEGFSQALLEDVGEGLGAEPLDHLRRIRDASKRMAQLIDDLLNLSRLMRAELRVKRVDLSSIARSVMMELKNLDPSRRVQWRIEEGLIAEGDERLLRVVLDNLIGNAWKFTAGKDPAHIEFGSLGPSDGRTVYYVRDDGAGFDMKYVSRLFGAFQRLHTAGEFPGTGVGLATVQRIIHRHGGRVWAEGETGKGATFYFTL